MSSKLLDRAFNKALSAQQVEQQEQELAQPRVRTQQDEEAELRQLDARMDATDAIQRMLLAQKDKDYFRLLELPLPEADELGRPTWTCTASDVSKQYRRLSMLVHPDKNPGDDARKAFEALNAAHKALRDPGQLEELLNKAAETARRRREAAEASATPQERVALFAAKKQRVKSLQQQQGGSFQAEIQKQMQLRLTKAKRKRSAASSYRKDGDSSDDDKALAVHHIHAQKQRRKPEGSDDEEEGGLTAHLARRGRPKAIM